MHLRIDRMLYKCIICKEGKFFAQISPTESGYCVKCQRVRSFLPDTSSASSARRTTEMSDTFEGKKLHPSNMERFRGKLGPVASSTNNIARLSNTSTLQNCDYFKLCLEFMLSVGYSKRLFNRKHNRCYCQECYPARSKDVFIEGGAKYVIPRGWVRFGLYIDDAQAEVERIWNKWVVSYHGTSPQSAKSIIEHHQFLLPGDQCMGGHVIRIREGHIPNKFQVYTSPTIIYSGDDIYTPAIPFRSKSGRSYKAKVVLQCRQQPETFKVQAETIGAGSRRICPIIPNNEVEYFSEVRSSIIPYGLLIRVFQ
ncbi:unnamed protein product [Rotaria socialis]|uniref:Uncharacterized protein n=1 Tax=Rotaria socialis TaxID=392032 RepID=A0A820WJF3_9BILA|nr:unnamed protein product [Rotaria socialis]CAF4518364.1 unnamed protein product [Rotaria socialis]